MTTPIEFADKAKETVLRAEKICFEKKPSAPSLSMKQSRNIRSIVPDITNQLYKKMVEYFQKGLVVCDYDRIIGFTDRGAGGIMEIGLVDALSAKQPEFQKMLRLWNLMISIK